MLSLQLSQGAFAKERSGAGRGGRGERKKEQKRRRKQGRAARHPGGVGQKPGPHPKFCKEKIRDSFIFRNFKNV